MFGWNFLPKFYFELTWSSCHKFFWYKLLIIFLIVIRFQCLIRPYPKHDIQTIIPKHLPSSQLNSLTRTYIPILKSNNTTWTITTQFSYQNLHTNLEIETTQLEQTTNVEVTCWTIKLVAKTNPSFILVQCNWWATWIKLLLHIFMIQWLDHNMIIHEIENEWGKKI